MTGERKAKVLRGLVMTELINMKENRGYLCFVVRYGCYVPREKRFLFYIFKSAKHILHGECRPSEIYTNDQHNGFE